MHGVEGAAGDAVVGEVVDGVSPEGEARAALGQHQLYAALCARTCRAEVQQQHRHSGALQPPLVTTRRTQVQVGQRATHVHLRLEAAEGGLDLEALLLGDGGVVVAVVGVCAAGAAGRSRLAAGYRVLARAPLHAPLAALQLGARPVLAAARVRQRAPHPLTLSQAESDSSAGVAGL